MRDGQDVDEELIHAKDDVSAKRSNTIAFQISEFYMKFDVDENCDVCEGFSDLARRDYVESVARMYTIFHRVAAFSAKFEDESKHETSSAYKYLS
jgi:hypothetical protein